MASTAASAPAPASAGAVPARLGFLAIFNPSLGNTDETIDDQIVYYASVTTQSRRSRRRRTRGRPTDAVSHEERNERLRQIGLAQGMASFSRGFADGASVDAIDTERSRVVMHELEPGWWILASIDLTKVPLPPRLPTKSGEGQEERFEHSTREMKPPMLLLRDLLRAHRIFLMHHGSSLSALFVRCRRSKFVAVLSRYWDLFLSTWSVVLHGNPARDVLGCINVAASGELGVGVGEEDRGSGEREVLEGLVGRIEGLVDLVVSKFGTDDDPEDAKDADKREAETWLGTGQEPAAEDGAIFLGTGAISRKSLRDVAHWMEDLYTWGEHAYGVIESPTSIRRAKARKAAKSAEMASKPDTAEEAPRPSDSTRQASAQPKQSPPEEEDAPAKEAKNTEDGKLDKMLNYMKLGYGSYWNLPGSSNDSPGHLPKEASEQRTATSKEPRAAAPRPTPPRRSPSQEAAGHYLIGLKGEIEESQDDADVSPTTSDSEAEHNSRTVLRTVHVELESGDAGNRAEATVTRDFAHPASVLTQSQTMGNTLPGCNSHDLNKAEKLRVVVYVNKPFIFTFVFRLRTDSLAWDALYRSLHYQLAPLKKPLLASTSYRPERPEAGAAASSSIYNLVWDPPSLTVHSSIPNIPELATSASWSRADAVNTHLHLLNIHSATRSRAEDLERTYKTNRGWWLVWTRLLQRPGGDPTRNLSTIHESSSVSSSVSSLGSETGKSRTGDEDDPSVVAKEILLIRRASEHAGLRGLASDGTGSDGAGKLAQGIGVDTRRYVEELLNLL
ncbi:hypothetical protein TOPH_09002 [Tolypocladium ophioglossoides CBS 100239]|uniref:CCZ1/INTU/HSP4 first Longin domain-containing protein n=1 Tax=Tolypocladium ophioglossoides (strain CBS 100239) TaxID=1163406 RepID=A0A0L0MWS4_TOLOC|nr:hypothetical protein TOPH_09002 [Tolypocladium ophioglossoides CBS 100239]